jgi:hypothetical protein
MSEIKIDPEFRDTLPPLAPDELAKLEANLIHDGCREPLMLWQGTLVDGHNRYEICTRLNLPYQTNYLDVPDRDSAMLWMLENQGGRRNLADVDRIAIARKKEVIIARRALQNKAAAGGDRKSEEAKSLMSKSTEAVTPILTRAEAAKEAGVGQTKYDEGKVILEAVESGEAPKEILDKLRAGETSIHKEATKIKEARKPQPPVDEYTAPESPAKPPNLGKFILDQTGHFMPEIMILIRKISPKDIKFESALNDIIELCRKRLTTNAIKGKEVTP